MALIQEMPTPPLFTDGTAYSAGLVRRLLGRLLGGQVGRFVGGDFAATLNGSTVTVAAGRGTIPAPAAETGTYLVESLVATVLTLDPADATRDRLDRLVAYVVPPLIPADSGKWFLAIRKGEPSAAPVAPDASDAYLIAEFSVPKASDGVPPSVVDKRYNDAQFYFSGPSLWGSAKPAVPRPGQLFTDSTTGQSYVHQGSEWVRVNQGVPAVVNPSSVIAPYADQIIYDKTAAAFKRYVGTQFDEIAAAVAKGKRWRTAGFQSLSAGGTAVSMQAGRVQGGVTQTVNGLVIPRDGVYRAWLYGYATGASNWRAEFNLYRVRSSVAEKVILFLGMWKPDGDDYSNYVADEVPLRAGDEVYLRGRGSGSTWGVDELSGVRIGIEYVRSLPAGVTPI